MFPSLSRLLNSKKNRLGISRRELALVIVVVIFGAGLLYRVTEPSRERRRMGTCRSNLQQIGMAMMAYSQDHDEMLPRAWFGKDAGPSDATTNYKWMDAIFPYVKEEKFFNCPSDYVSKPYRFRSGTNYGSYVINNAYYAPGDEFTPPAGRDPWARPFNPLSTQSNPILVADGENDFQLAWPDVKSSPQIDVSNINELRKLGTMTQRHLRTANRLFCDGRVSSYPLRQDAAPKTINGHQIFTGLTIEDD